MEMTWTVFPFNIPNCQLPSLICLNSSQKKKFFLTLYPDEFMQAWEKMWQIQHAISFQTYIYSSSAHTEKNWF